MDVSDNLYEDDEDDATFNPSMSESGAKANCFPNKSTARVTT